MDFSPVGRVCSFCGTVGTAESTFVGGLGAMMCGECLDSYHQLLNSPQRQQAVTRPPWEAMSDAEMLERLRLILLAQEQSSRFVADWIGLVRGRNISWAAIGRVLGVSRQAAWERFGPEASPKNRAG